MARRRGRSPVRRPATLAALGALVLAACAPAAGPGGEAAPGPAFAASPLYDGKGPWAGPPGVSLRHALVLTARDPRFGGWSGVSLGPAGAVRRLVAVSDRGYWLQATLDPVSGRLESPRLGRLGDLDGRPLLDNDRRDAEEVVLLDDGSALVSFERDHRLWLYPPAAEGASAGSFGSPPVALPVPPGLDAVPENGGMEAMARLPDGRLLILVEGEDGAATAQGWLGQPQGPLSAATAATGADAAPAPAPAIRWDGFRLALEDGFRVTAAATDGTFVYIVERAFSPLAGFRTWICRLPLTAFDAPSPEVPLVASRLVALSTPPAADNFEGLLAEPEEDGGETVLRLISDDNYNGLQRTLWIGLGVPTGGGRDGALFRPQG
jgi:hypothetical protein